MEVKCKPRQTPAPHLTGSSSRRMKTSPAHDRPPEGGARPTLEVNDSRPL
jgi:hypothetical protein